MMNIQTVVLEPSTNSHSITNVLEFEQIENSVVKLKTNGDSKVIHGEHGIIGVESPYVMKYTQQELNPLTKAFQNAFD
jgi:hypothetical protein